MFVHIDTNIQLVGFLVVHGDELCISIVIKLEVIFTIYIRNADYWCRGRMVS